MLKIAKTEFYKLKRYSVVWIGVATMLTVVLLTRFMATASDGAVHTLEYFSNSVIWNNFSLIFPATITLIAGYIIERERVDDTLKNIMTIPIPFRKLLAGKLIAVGGLAIILAAIEFVFTMIVFFISRFPGFSFAGMILALVRMIGMNLFVYVAVLPIIVFTGQHAGSFMAGVLAHSRELTVFTNPLPNSYQRFGCDEAPRYVSWSRQNRSQLVRIPQVKGDNCRMELRSPDPACNPYLAVGLVLAAGLDGIEHRMVLQAPINKNLFDPTEAAGLGLERLPSTLEEAVQAAQESEFLHRVLPEELSHRYYEEELKRCAALKAAADPAEYERVHYFNAI